MSLKLMEFLEEEAVSGPAEAEGLKVVSLSLRFIASLQEPLDILLGELYLQGFTWPPITDVCFSLSSIRFAFRDGEVETN